MKLNVKRLLKLAKFLDKLPESHFDFGVERGSCTKTKENRCGTIGCAIGWTPAVFPRLVRAVDEGWISYVLHRKSGVSCYYDVASVLFSMPIDHAWKLFTPDRRSPADGQRLAASTSPKRVAARIRTYVKWAQKKLKASK